MRNFDRLSPRLQEKLKDLESRVNKYENKEFEKFCTILLRILTPIRGDKDIWYCCKALDELIKTNTNTGKAIAILSIGCKYTNFALCGYFISKFVSNLF